MIELLENETLKLAIDLATLLGFCYALIIFGANLSKRIEKGTKLSRSHFEDVISISASSEAYLSSCVLILLTRILTSLFLVIISTAFLAIALFSDVRSDSAERTWLVGFGLTGSVMDYVALLFFILSCALFVGTVISATNYSRAVRRSVNKESVKAPFARALFGFKD